MSTFITGKPGDDGPAIFTIFAASFSRAKLSPVEINAAVLDVDAALVGHTDDEILQILSFMLMNKLGIEVQRSN